MQVHVDFAGLGGRQGSSSWSGGLAGLGGVRSCCVLPTWQMGSGVAIQQPLSAPGYEAAPSTLGGALEGRVVARRPLCLLVEL